MVTIRKLIFQIIQTAPSDYPEIVEFLVENGIDSISLNPDVIGRMKQVVAKVEEKYGKKA